jgi:hypothetical protein
MAKATRIEPEPLRNLAGMVPLGTDVASVRKRIEAMEHLLEGLFRVPGTNYKIGLDVILDLIPVGGDVIGSLMGAWMVWEARNLGMPKLQMARMFGNVGVDFVLGLIPVIGAVPDALFRSNSRNLKIIKRHLDKYHPSSAVITQR